MTHRMLFTMLCIGLLMTPGFTGELGTEEGAQVRKLPQVLSSVDLKFWGRVVMNVHYDTDDLRGNTDFATYLTGEGREEVNFNGRDTRFGFAASSPGGSPWKTGIVAEMDFYGDNSGNNLIPRMRLGYLKLENDKGLSIRMGQDWIPIGQQNPDTIDFGILAWGGNLWWRVPQLTMEKRSGHFKWLVSLMKHRVSNSQENQEDMPWLIGRMSWERENGLLAFGLAGRSVEVEERDYDPFLAVLEFKQNLGTKVRVTGEFWQGSGVGREFVRYGLDYNHQQGQEIEGKGGFLSVAVKVRRGSINAGYGVDDPSDEDIVDTQTGLAIAAPFLRNEVGFVNYQWQLNKQFGGGFELMNFKTVQVDAVPIEGQRATLSFGYKF